MRHWERVSDHDEPDPRYCECCGREYDLDGYDVCMRPECSDGQEHIQDEIADRVYHERRGQ